MLRDLFINTPDYLQSGGGVLIPIILISFWMWGLIIGKWLELQRSRKLEKPSAECIEHLGDPDFAAAPWQKEIMSLLWELRRSGRPIKPKTLEPVVRKQEAWFDRSVSTILVLSFLSPLLGLLGTVIGMIETFDVISQFGTGNARAMAGGISEALITTQTGLIVAVPGLFIGNFLRRRAENAKGRVERFTLNLQRTLQIG